MNKSTGIHESGLDIPDGVYVAHLDYLNGTDICELSIPVKGSVCTTLAELAFECWQRNKLSGKRTSGRYIGNRFIGGEYSENPKFRSVMFTFRTSTEDPRSFQAHCMNAVSAAFDQEELTSVFWNEGTFASIDVCVHGYPAIALMEGEPVYGGLLD